MTNETTLPEHEATPTAHPTRSEPSFVLSVLWCGDEPWRIGECIVVPERSVTWLGRGPSDAGRAKLGLIQLRPRSALPCPPLGSRAVSRYQLRLEGLDGGRCLVTNVGRRQLLCNGRQVTECEISAHDMLQVGQQLLLMAHTWDGGGGPLGFAEESFQFGEEDPHGMVGESCAIWHLRQQIAFVASRADHVLLHGASGTGKELVARAIHGRSSRQDRPLVARNAATLPDGLVDSELFGHAKNYPNPGMPGSPGLIGEADGSTLFLDEFAELPLLAQAHLLRVMDRGEYHRLGETRARVADFRLIAATNREPSVIKEDILARFAFRVELPDLNRRKEDIPLLIRHLLRTEAERGDPDAFRLFPAGDLHCEPDLSLACVERLVKVHYQGHVRELRSLLFRELGPGPEVPNRTGTNSTPAPALLESSDQEADPALLVELAPAQIQRALDDNNGSIEHTWRALGLRNRFVLTRLMKKHGLLIKRRAGAPDRRSRPD